MNNALSPRSEESRNQPLAATRSGRAARDARPSDLNGPQHGDLPLFRQWDSSAKRFKPEALSVCDIRALFSTRLKTLFPSLPVIGVHTYRICSNNLMIAANVPLATRMWFHNWGQAKASALSEVIYRRLLQNDIQYHQAIITKTLFTFVAAAKRHIAA